MIFLTLSFLLYFAPALLATSRRAPNAADIWLTNFFVGWTVIGWILTLVWALNTPPLPYVVPVVATGFTPNTNPAAGFGAPVSPVSPEPGTPYASAAYAASPSATTESATSQSAGPARGYTSQAAGAGAVPSWSAVADPATGREPVRTCTSCGRIVPADARFCPACGSVESRLG